MKKLFVVLALATGSFAQTRLASGQSPAPPSSESTTPIVSGSTGAGSIVETATVNSDDSERVARAASVKPSPEKLRLEAFVDLNRIMKEASVSSEQMSALKDRIHKFDQECKEQQTKLTALQVELQAATESSLRRQLEKELAEGKAKFQARIAETKKQFLTDEANIINDVYEQIRAVTADYAKENGIHRVTRSQSVARTEDKVDGTDRTAVLQRVNRPIIYSEGASESPADITDAIIQRLNDSESR
jgi:Skp family chaperone for outer membrane proteins